VTDGTNTLLANFPLQKDTSYLVNFAKK